MSEKKYYAIGSTSPEGWERLHAIMTQDGTLDDNIPSRAVECTDLKEHSPTRAVYLLDDEEAAQVAAHPDIQFIQIDRSQYPDLYPPRPDELHWSARYATPAKHHRDFGVGGYPNPTTTADINRAGYQVLRGSTYENPWAASSSATILSTVTNATGGTGIDIDVIVGDEGCWLGHVEFANNTGNGPVDYKWANAGNLLSSTGTCDVLDVVLDGPYYIDPAWFNANPGTRLTTRWDGSVLPVESVARDWWGNASQRSSQFAGAGTVAIPSSYTRANTSGSNLAKPTGNSDGNHGTPCSAQTYGRTHGWAYNANKWVIDAYGGYGFGINVDLYFDVMKIFHLNKPINPVHGNRNPTISSNSWGFRATQGSSGNYYFRQGTTGAGGVAYSSKPRFMQYLGSTGDGGRFKGEMLTNNLTVAGDELIASGVIFVVAAGNSNQQQVSSSHPNFNNYWSSSPATPLASATHDEFGSFCYNTTNRRGFPQQLGKYTTGTTVVYPAINIGALDDNYQLDGKERKVNYSDMGNEIDVFTPGDGTLSANMGSGLLVPRHDQRAGGLTSYDGRFSGTSSACPTAAGMIATALEFNRTWTWQDVRTWLGLLTNQSASTFYQGVDPASATDVAWSDLNSLMGAAPRVLYNSLPVVSSMTLTVAVSTVSVPAYSVLSPVTPVVASNGVAPYVYSIAPTVPAGILYSTSTGALSGSPTVLSSTTSYTVTVRDAELTVKTAQFSIAVTATVLTTVVNVPSTSVSPLIAFTPFVPVTATGGNGNVTLAVSPAMPSGIVYNTTTGAVSGTPASAFSNTYAVTATDQLEQKSTGTFNFSSVSIPLSLTLNTATKTLTVFQSVTPFVPVSATGGNGIKTWSVSPALPAGLSLNTATGTIIGTPTASIVATSYVVRVTDQLGLTDTRTFVLSVEAPALTTTLTISRVLFFPDIAIDPFSPVTVSSSAGSVTFSVSPPLPDGLTLNTGTGVISGTPTVTGRSNVYTILVVDQVGQQSVRSFRLKIKSKLDLIDADDQNIVYDRLFSLMGTTVTGYGAIPASEPVDYGQIVRDEDWDKMYDDLIRVKIHQYGVDTNNLLIADPGNIVLDGVQDRIYTWSQLHLATSSTVHPSQLSSMTVNTNEMSPPEWISEYEDPDTWTNITGNGYIAAAGFTWFRPAQLNYFFNLGGSITPQISLGQGTIRDYIAWDPLVQAANQLKFSKTQFYSALNSLDKSFVQVVRGPGNIGSVTTTSTYSANAIIIKYQIVDSRILASIQFVASFSDKKKKKNKKKKGGNNIVVRLQVNTNFLTRYSNNLSGGIAAPVPQTQLINDCLSIDTRPVDPFVFATGSSNGPRNIVLRNNSTQTCNISNVFLTGYTTGTVSPTVLTIPPNSSGSINLSYSGNTAGLFKGFVNIESNVNNFTIFTQVEVGSITPPALNLTTGTLDIVSQDFVVDMVGGAYEKFDAELSRLGNGFGFTEHVETVAAETMDRFNVTFDPRDLATGTYVTTATVTVYPLDNNSEVAVFKVPVNINLNIRRYNIARWSSALGPQTSALGLSFDYIDGKRYLTVGIGTNSPVLSQLGTTSTFGTWSEVSRMIIEDRMETLHSAEYLIKSDSNYGSNFGIGAAFGSIVTVKNQKYGNIEILMNPARYPGDDVATTNIVKFLSSAFYYFDPTVNRITQLETATQLSNGGYTRYFNTFDKDGSVVTSLVVPNGGLIN